MATGRPDALRVSKGALCQARYRLGARPLVELFRRVCKPLATSSTPQAFLFGLRLMALDATVMDVPTRRKRKGLRQAPHPRGESAWPQIRLVAISECSTHAVCEAGVWPTISTSAQPDSGCSLAERGPGCWCCGTAGSTARDGQRRARRGAYLLGRLPLRSNRFRLERSPMAPSWSFCIGGTSG